MTGWFSPFLFYLSRCTENELRRHIEFLKAENEMLRTRGTQETHLSQSGRA
jgi:hypothetical protein